MQLRRTLQAAVTFLSTSTVSQRRARHRQQRPILIAIFALASLLAFAVPSSNAQTTCEPLEKGDWKQNRNDWPVTSLLLGSNTYTQQQLLAILKMPVGGDASVMLAQQLIAALLNIANGTDPVPIDTTIGDANGLLGGGRFLKGSNLTRPSANRWSVMPRFLKATTRAC